MPNQEPAFAWPFGNGPVRVGTQGLFRLWCQYAMMMLTNTFCRCAHSNCATSGTFSFLSKRRNRYRVLCTRFQYVYRDRRKPRRFRFHQQKIIFERIVIRSSPLEIHLNRKGQTKHSIDHFLTFPLFIKPFSHDVTVAMLVSQNQYKSPGQLYSFLML